MQNININIPPRDFGVAKLTKWLMPDTIVRLYDFYDLDTVGSDACHSIKDFQSTTSHEKRLIQDIHVKGRLVTNSFKYI
jgi:hypothetical protein